MRCLHFLAMLTFSAIFISCSPTEEDLQARWSSHHGNLLTLNQSGTPEDILYTYEEWYAIGEKLVNSEFVWDSEDARIDDHLQDIEIYLNAFTDFTDEDDNYTELVAYGTTELKRLSQAQQSLTSERAVAARESSTVTTFEIQPNLTSFITTSSTGDDDDSDGDGDGVSDDDDNCPNTGGGTDVGSDGCGSSSCNSACKGAKLATAMDTDYDSLSTAMKVAVDAAVADAEANGTDVSDETVKNLKEKQKNEKNAQTCPAATCNPVELPTGHKVTDAVDMDMPLLNISRVHRISQLSAWSLGQGWHSSLDSRIVLGVEVENLANLVALQQDTVQGYEQALAKVDELILYFETNYEGRSGFSNSKAQNKLNEILTDLAIERSAIINTPELATDPLVIARQELTELTELLALSDVRKQQNQYAVDSNTPSEEMMGVEIIKWVSPTGNRVVFADSTRGGISPVGGHANNLSRISTGYRLETQAGLYYFYNEYGLLTKVEDEVGTFIQVSRNSSQQATKLVDQFGLTWQLSYNSAGRLTRITDPENRTLQYKFDGKQRLTEVIGFDGTSQQYKYDYAANDYVITAKYDGEGNKTYYDFETTGAETIIKTQYDEDDHAWSYQYDFSNNSTTMVNRNGLSVSHKYNSDFKFTQKNHGVFGSENYQYDSDGNLTHYWNELNELTQYSYNDLGQVLTVTDAENRTTTFTRDNRGRLLTATDNAGNTTRYVRDSNGQIDRVEFADGTLIEESWANGLLQERIDQDGNITQWSYDAFGHPSRIDYYGASIGDNDDSYRVLAIDKLGRIESVIEGNDADQRTTTYSYFDDNGNSLNQPTRITDPLGREAKYQYDGNGQLVYEKDFSGVETVYTYTARRKLASKTISMPNPDGSGVIEYQYSYEYDAENNLAYAYHPENLTWQYSYDLRNHLIKAQIVGTDVIQTYEYDALGRKIKDNDNALGLFEYNYYGDDQIASITNPLGNSQTFTYDARGLLSSVFDSTIGTDVTTLQRDQLGQVAASINANQTYQYVERNGRGLVTSSSLPDDASQARVSYQYNWRGQVTEQSNIEGGVITYQYNVFGELIEATDSENGFTQLEYDALGRKIYQLDPAGLKTTWEYDQQDHQLIISQTQTDTTLSIIRSDRTRTNTETYDLLGRLVRTVDALDQQWEYHYNLRGLLTQIDYPDASGVQYQYNAAGQNVAETLTAVDGSSRTTTFERDAKGRVISQTNANYATTRYRYNGLGLMTEQTLADGFSTVNYEYDALGRKVLAIYPENYTERWAYDALGNVIEYTDRNDKVWTYSYTLDNQVSEANDPLSVYAGKVTPTQYQYDLMARPVSTIDPNGNEQSQLLDSMGRVMQVLDGYNQAVTFERDSAGRVISQTDRLGQTTTFSYNAFGELESTTDALDNSTDYRFDALGRQVEQEDALNNISEWAYNFRNQPVLQTDALGRSTAYNYNAFGEQQSVTLPDGAVTQYDRDNLGRLAAVVDANGNRTQYQYDDRNQLISTTDPLGNSTAYNYDSLGRVTYINQAEYGTDIALAYNGQNQLIERQFQGTTEQYNYDALGRLTQITNPASNESYQYDAAGNRTQVINATLDKTINYSYDANNNRIGMTDPNEDSDTTYERDAMGRIVSLSYGDADTTTFDRDELGRVVTRTLENGTRDLTQYDELGRIEKITLQVEDRNHRGYDDQFYRGFSTPNNSRWSRYRDSWQRTNQHRHKSHERDGWRTEDQHTYLYDEVGNLSARLYNEKFSFFYEYDENDRLTNAYSPESLNTSYQWDAVGNLTQKQERNLSYNYQYNANNQMVQADHWRLRAYGFNRNNIRYRDDSTDADEHHLDQENLFQYRWNPDSRHEQTALTKRYDYNANGQLASTSLNNGEEVETYQHDALGRMTSQTTGHKANYQFAYDALDRRVHTELNDWHRGYAFSSLYDQRQEVAQWDTDNKPYRNLNYLPNEEQGLPYGTLISQSVPQWQKSEFRATGHSRNLASKAYYHQDRQGSTIKVTGENPSNSYRWDYTPFGEAYGFENRYSRNNMGHSHSSNSPQRDLIPYLYTGKYQTSLSGLIDMDARWYNPQVGRFMQPDYYNLAELALPKGARNKLLATTGLNSQMLLNDPAQQMRYGYVSGNPMRWVDPMGLEVLSMGRDLAKLSSLPGLHQFSVLIPDNQGAFDSKNVNGTEFEYIELIPAVKENGVIKVKPVHGYVLGAHKDIDSDSLIFISNETSDVIAAKQALNSSIPIEDDTINFSTVVYDVVSDIPDTELVDLYLEAAANYAIHSSVNREPYADPNFNLKLTDGDNGNSNSWNQTLHDVVGSETVEDMFGFDIYHEYRLNEELFSYSCPAPR